MDEQVIDKLRTLNNAFYRDNCRSFSAARQHAWEGWGRVTVSLPAVPVSVLDVACGNMRFKSFLESTGREPERYFAVDSCSELIPADHDASFQELDIVRALIADELATRLEAPRCTLVTCFGFMHHVPTCELRMRLMSVLIEMAQPGGIVAISFWQFAHDEVMQAKAVKTTERGCEELGLQLGAGDYLLGWNEIEGAYRYCHSFTDDEIDEIAAVCEGRAHVVDRFSADGRTGQMNAYLVLRT